MIKGSALGPLGYHTYVGEVKKLPERSCLSSHIVFADDEEVYGREHFLCPLPSLGMDPPLLIPSSKPPLGGEAEQGVGKKPHHLLLEFLGHGPQMDDGETSPFRRHSIYTYGRSTMV
jgi:hypothetical protein